jgi:hypothetical protein
MDGFECKGAGAQPCAHNDFGVGHNQADGQSGAAIGVVADLPAIVETQLAIAVFRSSVMRSFTVPRMI